MCEKHIENTFEHIEGTLKHIGEKNTLKSIKAH